jgi:hypothetical protein
MTSFPKTNADSLLSPVAAGLPFSGLDPAGGGHAVSVVQDFDGVPSRTRIIFAAKSPIAMLARRM